MANDDPREALRDLYREGLRKVGFDQTAIDKGLAMLESDRYCGFPDVVASLRVESPVAVREHQVEWVVQHIATQEARVAVTSRGRRAAGRLAAQRVEEAAHRDEELHRARRRVEELRALLGEMTGDELDGRVPLRPHIAEALREQAGYDGEFRVRPRPRPSWVGRAPAPAGDPQAGPGLKRLMGGLAGSRSTEAHAGSGSDPLRIVEAEAGGDVDAEPTDLVETFKDLGLSAAAAERAAGGR